MTANDQNQDFQTLISTREALVNYLSHQLPSPGDSANRPTWEDQEGGLLLSMGMSSDFEAAIRAGGGIVRVGTGIFGARHNKNGDTASQMS